MSSDDKYDALHRIIFEGTDSNLSGLFAQRAACKQFHGSFKMPILTDMQASFRSLYVTDEYVARVLAPSDRVKDSWRIRTQVQLVTHPYLRGVRGTVGRFVDLVALVDKALYGPCDDEFCGYGYLNETAAFARED